MRQLTPLGCSLVLLVLSHLAAAAPVGADLRGPGTWRRHPSPPIDFRSTYLGAHDPVRNEVYLYLHPPGELWRLRPTDPPTWEELALAPPLPIGLAERSFLACDAEGRRLVLMHGAPPGIWTLALDGGGSFEAPVVEGTPPPRAGLHLAVHDPVNRRLLVPGDLNAAGTAFGALYELRFTPTFEWRRIPTRGTAPGSRHGQEAAYDPVHERLVVQWGGGIQPSYIWTLSVRDSLPEWIRYEPGGNRPPGSLVPPALVFDREGGRLLSQEDSLRVLTFDPSPRWQTIGTGGARPAPRDYATFIADPIRGRLLFMAGSDAVDVWELSDTPQPSWRSLAGPPRDRHGAAVAFDPREHRLIVMGGDGRGKLDDVWECRLDPAPHWRALPVEGPGPGVRLSHSAVVDLQNNEFIIHGGIGEFIYYSDTWALSLDPPHRWRRIDEGGAGVERRTRHAAVYDPVRQELVVSGGISASSYSHFYHKDASALTLVGSATWTPFTPDGSPHSADFSGIFDPVRSKPLFFGGYASSTSGGHPPVTTHYYYSSVRETASESERVIRPIAVAGTPPPGTSDHALVLDSRLQRMIVVGGAAPGGLPQSMPMLDLRQDPPAWSTIGAPGDNPRSRTHVAFYDPRTPAIVAWQLTNPESSTDSDGAVWTYEWDDPLVGAVETEAGVGRVSVSWALGTGHFEDLRVHRREPGGAWIDVGAAQLVDANRATFHDSSVEPETEYAYRLGISLAGYEWTLGEVRATAPARPILRVREARASERGDVVTVALDVPDSRPIDVVLVSVTGRLIAAAAISRPDAAVESISLRAGAPLPSGVYFVQVRQGDDRVSGRVLVVRQ
jgi:hypothetical protein